MRSLKAQQASVEFQPPRASVYPQWKYKKKVFASSIFKTKISSIFKRQYWRLVHSCEHWPDTNTTKCWLDFKCNAKLTFVWTSVRECTLNSVLLLDSNKSWYRVTGSAVFCGHRTCVKSLLLTNDIMIAFETLAQIGFV